MNTSSLAGTAEEAAALTALGTTTFADTEVGLLQQIIVILCVA